MRSFFLCFLFLICPLSFSKNSPDKVLLCNERGCSCKGKGCAFVDKRVIKNASTISITCPGTTNCGIKIVYALFDKYACKASVQKIHDQDYMVVTECLVIDLNGSEYCPIETTTESIEDLLKICLEKTGT